MININYEGKILILELPEGERTGSCSINKEQQSDLINETKQKFKQIINENGGTLVVPPRTKITIMDLHKNNSNY